MYFVTTMFCTQSAGFTFARYYLAVIYVETRKELSYAIKQNIANKNTDALPRCLLS